VTGAIGDGTNPADISIAGGGELNLAGSNTYRGTTYVNQGMVTIRNDTALGNGSIAQVQTITLTGAVAGTTQLALSFKGDTTATIGYTGTVADVGNIQNALNALHSIGG